MDLITVLENSGTSIEHLKLHSRTPKNDIQKSTGFSGLFVDQLGRYYMARDQLTSSRFTDPIDAVYDWHKRSISKRASGKFIHNLYRVSVACPEHVKLEEIAYLIDFNFKSGFKGTYKHTDSLGEYFVCRRKVDNKFVTSEQRKHPAAAVWDVHTMRNVFTEDAYEIPKELRKEDFGAVNLLAIAHMIDPTNKSGYTRVMFDTTVEGFVGVYQTNGVVNRTKSYPTPEQAAWAVHNLVQFASKHLSSRENRRKIGRRSVDEIVKPLRQAYTDTRAEIKNA